MLTFKCFNYEKPFSIFVHIIFAKEVLHIFENKYPNDMRPRNGIEAAEAWLNDRTEANAAYAAAAKAAARAAAAKAAARAAAATAAYAAAVYAAVYAAAYAAAAYVAADATYAAADTVYIASTARAATNAEYIHQILFKNLSNIIDFHIKEGNFFEQPEVVFQYLNEKQKERFVYEMDLLC